MTMDYARRIPRFLAWLLDIIVLGIVLGILNGTGVIEAFPEEGETVSTGDSIIQAVVILVYFIGLTAALGQTLGKMALGIKVVDIDGNKASLSAVLIREVIVRALGTILTLLLGSLVGSAIGPIGFLIGIVVVAWILFDDQRQGLHDKAAKTFVVKT